jgi:hypothetical protein
MKVPLAGRTFRGWLLNGWRTKIAEIGTPRRSFDRLHDPNIQPIF